jgi:glycosyltransferase involved in cell wall biosynthesis
MMTTYNRPKLFRDTIESIEKTNADLSGLHIFDDCSTDKKQIQFLYSLSSKYEIYYQEKNRGTVLNTIPNIEYMFQKYDSEYLVVLQDDLLFSKSWLERGIGIFGHIKEKHFNVAYLSLFNREKTYEEKYYIMKSGHPGGVAIIIDRQFWNVYRKQYDIHDYGLDLLNDAYHTVDHKIRNLVDYKMGLRAINSGWVIARVGKSLIAHMGDESSMVNVSNREDIRADCMRNFVGVEK